MMQNLPSLFTRIVLLSALLSTSGWLTAQCDPPSLGAAIVTGTNSATVCWTSGQSDVTDHLWNVKANDLTAGISAAVDVVVAAGTAGLTISPSASGPAPIQICYDLSLPDDDTDYELLVSELCDGDVSVPSGYSASAVITTDAAAPGAPPMPTAFQTINRSVTHTASFTDIALDPNPVTGDASRLEFTRDLLDDVQNIGQPSAGLELVISIIENVLDVNVPEWLESAGTSLGIPGVIEFEPEPTLEFGITANYGGFIGIGSVGKADVDVTYPVDLQIRAPEDQAFGCGDKVTLETSATRGSGATIAITPAFYETELGPILEDFAFVIRVGLKASIRIGCIPDVGCAYRNSWNVLDLFGVDGDALELVNVDLDVPINIPAFLQLCEEAFDDNANLGTLGDCVTGTSIFEEIVNLLSADPQTQVALNSLATFTDTEVQLRNPDLPPGVDLTIPEFDGTFKKITASDLEQSFDGNKIQVEVEGGKFEELSRLRLDLISLLDYFGLMTSVSTGFGLGELDFGDLNLNLSTDLVLDYEFDPDFYADVDLGEVMDWSIVNPNNGNVINSGISQLVPNVLMGYNVVVEIPDDFTNTTTVETEHKMAADFTTMTEIEYLNSLSFSLFQLESTQFNFAIALVDDFEIVENPLGDPITIEDHTLNWDTDDFNKVDRSFELVPDQTAPVAVCKPTTVSLNEWGTASIQPSDVFDDDSFDLPANGTGQVKVVSLMPNAFDCDDTGAVTTTLTIEDENCNMATCTATVTVLDEIRPEISCAPNFVQENDLGECGAEVAVPRPDVKDNCSYTLTARYRPLDDSNNALAGWSGWSSDPDGFYAVGRWEVQWRAKDPSGNQRRCKIRFDIIDTEKPVLNCFDPTYVFNGEESLDLILADFSTATDNCGIAVHEIDLDIIYCEQLGEVLTVTSTAIDIYDNFSSCTSTLTIDGLPCGWKQEPDGVGCDDGNLVDYDVPTEVFSVSSTDCHNAVTTGTDEYAFGQYNLCGDGMITAQVTSITGTVGGWAGVTMRSGNDPEGQSVSLMTNLGSQHRTEVRLLDNGNVTSGLSPSFNRHWLRIQRIGNNFRGFVSFNGLSWFPKFNIYVAMDDCIELGLIANSSSASGDNTATFANVSVVGDPIYELIATPPTAGGAFGQPSYEADRKFNLFPNPTTGRVTIQLGDFLDLAGELEVLDMHGQQVRSLRRGLIEYSTEDVDLSSLPAGMYIVRLRLDDGTVQTQRVILLGSSGAPRP